ncbi:STAS domain-containing protein [Streptacidiphilus neutrinimicus]|uniref:STAS domain-containing protein n=1 Tax=Streptacidiphilus neutrinimicus TaxID=105420 RepID=UPI0005A6ED2E|nr:STAS domain-containing protein [Streptacidiphilus neutrinimicus]
MRPTALLPAPLLPRRGRDTAACLAPVIAVHGEVDFATVDQLCRHLEDQAAHHRQVTVDLSRATFYDQAAIDALTRTVAGARRAGCRISYTPPHLAPHEPGARRSL